MAGVRVIDERAFQEILAAAYLLQQHNDRFLAKSPRTTYTQVGTLAEYVGAPSVAPLTPETMAHPVLARERSPLVQRAYRDRALSKRFALTDELFWKTATFVAVAAVSTLLLLASVHRFSPLPTSLMSPTEVVKQQTPFQKARPVMTVPAQTGAFGAKTMTDQKPARHIDLDSQRAIEKRDPPRSVKRSEADIVAEDTVVRYSPLSAAPRQARKKP